MRILSIVSSSRTRLLLDEAAALLPTIEFDEFPADGLVRAPAAAIAVFDGDLPTARQLTPALAKLCATAFWVPPLSGDQMDMERLVRLARKNQLRLTPLRTAGFHPGLAALGEVLASGVLGRLATVAYARKGPWPMLPGNDNPKTTDADAYWDAEVLARFGAVETVVDDRPIAGLDADFAFSATLAGANGTAEHLQRWSAKGACECRLRTRFKMAGGRHWRQRFAPPLALACELASHLIRAIGR